jgi:hypothetical protein
LLGGDVMLGTRPGIGTVGARFAMDVPDLPFGNLPDFIERGSVDARNARAKLEGIHTDVKKNDDLPLCRPRKICAASPSPGR